MGARKEKLTLARTEAVVRLQALAEQIRQGMLVFGDQRIEVPEQVWLDISADSDQLELELKWKRVVTEKGERPPAIGQVPIRRACE